MTKPKLARNKAIARQYLAGATQSELAQKYGMSVGRISRLLKRHGARVDKAEQVRRAMGRGTGRTGRPMLYADNPKLRDEYLTLRQLYPAAQVHEMLRQSPNWK